MVSLGPGFTCPDDRSRPLTTDGARWVSCLRLHVAVTHISTAPSGPFADEVDRNYLMYFPFFPGPHSSFLPGFKIPHPSTPNPNPTLPHPTLNPSATSPGILRCCFVVLCICIEVFVSVIPCSALSSIFGGFLRIAL